MLIVKPRSVEGYDLKLRYHVICDIFIVISILLIHFIA